MKIFSKSGESAAGISVSKKFGFIALTIALASLSSMRSAFAARRHHAAAVAKLFLF